MKLRYAPLAAGAIALAGVAVAQPLHAHAANLPAICATLQTELNAASPGDTVTLTNGGTPCTAPTITYPITLPNKSITLTGALPGDGFNGGGTAQIMTGNDVGSTTISNLVFENGNSDSGGAALNIATNTGRLDLTLSGDTFRGNEGTYGAAYLIGDAGGDTSDTVTLTNNTFGGTASGQGNIGDGNDAGAVVLDTESEISITHNTFIDNQSQGPGNGFGVAGALFAISRTSDAKITFSDNTLRGNHIVDGPAEGGGASLQGGDVTVDNNTFDHNAIGNGSSSAPGELGGGLDVVATLQASGLYQAHNTFTGNAVGDFTYTNEGGPVYFGGGGEYAQVADITSLDDTFTGNSVGTAGNSSTLAAGGGIAIQGGESNSFTSVLTASNLVATGNAVNITGDGYGGGIYAGFGLGCDNVCPAEVDLHDSTIDDNTAAEGPGASGGGIPDVGKFYNDIVYGNSAPVGLTIGRGSRRVSSTSPVAQINYGSTQLTVQYTDSCNGSGAAYAGTGNICTDPLLVAPATGNVHETSSSPTINAGSNALVLSGVTQDYYGAARIQQGTVDQGAAEFAAAATPTPTPTPVLIPVPSTGAAGAGSSPAPWLVGFGGVLLIALGAAARGIRRRGSTG